MRRSSVQYAFASAAYALLTLALTWPLVRHPRTLVPSDLGDPLLVVWIMWWNATAVPLTDAWWNAPQFYPFRGSFALSEHMLGLAPVTTPIILATGEPLLAYNVTFLLAFFLSALAMHFFVFTLTRRHDLSFVAGVAFAFAPSRMPQIAHLQVLSTYWMPLALAGLHRYFAVGAGAGDTAPAEQKPGNMRWLVLFAGAWMMQVLACGYYLFSLSLFVVLWLGWFGLFRGQGRRLINLVAAWAIAAALLSPVLYGYWRFSRAYNLRRTLAEIHLFSADIASVLSAWHRSLFWGWLDVIKHPESDLFPGLTVVVLTALGIWLAWRRAPNQTARYPRVAGVLLVLGVVATAVAIARAVYGPFRIEIAGVRLFSVTSPEKPVSVAVLCFCSAVLLHPIISAAWRQRSVLAFYALATIAMWVMALGPAPTLMDVPVIYKAPYAWLLLLPGADGVRVPARFWMLAAFCLALTAALGLRLILERWPRSARWLPAVAVAGVLIDGWPRPLPMVSAPAPRPMHVEADARLELPVVEIDKIALYRATMHGRPLINGYSGFFAPHYVGLTQLLDEENPAVIHRLSEIGSLEIMVEHSMDADGRWRGFAARVPDARAVHVGPDYTTYFVPRRPSSTVPVRGIRLPFTVSSASINQELGDDVHDGDLITSWHAGRAQEPGDWIAVELGSPKEVRGVRLIIGNYTADYPRELLIETSNDHRTWSRAWRGPTALLAFSAALDHPGEAPIAIAFEPRVARYVRLTQTAPPWIHRWSVAELQIVGAPVSAQVSGDLR